MEAPAGEVADFVLNQCDVELVAEGQGLPTHSLWIARESEVLYQCISATLITANTAGSLPRIPLGENLATVKALLRCIYAREQKEHLQQLLHADGQVFRALIRAAHKYNMARLVQSCYTVLEAAGIAVCQDAASAVDWALLASDMGSPFSSTLERFESHLADCCTDPAEA